MTTNSYTPSHPWQIVGRESRQEYRHPDYPGWLLRKAKKLDAKKDNKFWRLWGTGALLTYETLEGISSEGLPQPLWLDLAHYTKLSEDEIALLLGFEQLFILDLRWCHLTDNSMSHIGQLASLRELDLSWSSISDHGLQKLQGLKKLSKLRVNGCKGLHLEGLPILPSLRMLDVGRLDISDAGWQQIASLPGLETLLLPWTPLRSGALEQLSHCGQLQKLHLHAEGCEDLEPLADLSGLKHLTLLKADGLDLSPIKFLSGLEYLDISGNQALTDEQVSEIIVSLPHLKCLHLEACPQLTSKSIEAVKKLSRLQHINVSGTEVDDEAVEHLSTLRYLRQLDLMDTRISKNNIQQLRESLPGCRLHHSN